VTGRIGRTARPILVKMKMSGAIRTFKDVADFAALRSVAATARKQRWNILQTLTAHPHALILSLAVCPPPWALRSCRKCRSTR
jgi:hypothetical protein